MNLKEIMFARRSIRKFKDTKVKEEDIKYLLEVAMAAPSACNRTPWEFYVVESQEILDKFYTIRPMRYKAPLAIVVCGNTNYTLKEHLADYYIQDCSAAIENILLGATELGLGSCWCGIVPQPDRMAQAKEFLSLEDNIIPFALVYIGYPDEEKEPRTQYDESKVHYVK